MAPPRLLAVLALASAAVAAGAGAGRRGLVRFQLGELQAASPATRARLRWALRSEGAVLLTDVPGLDGTAAEALDALGDCFGRLDREQEAADQKPVASPALLQGGVQRWTLATSTRAGSPEPLPEWASQACPGLPRPVERLRSFVSLILLHFAHSADAVAAAGPAAHGAELEAAAGRDNSFLSPPPAAGQGVRRTALEDLVRRGTLLEHFHRYRQAGAPAAAAQRPLGMHTDAGVLQALAVRWRARPGGSASAQAAVGLEVELPGGQVVAAEEDMASGVRTEEGGETAGGLLLMLGQASEEWLPHLRLRAAPHALAASASLGTSDASSMADRLVYGVMVLPPDDWQLLPQEAGNTTFGEWWRRAQAAVGGSPDKQTEATPTEAEGHDGCLSSSLLQRRLQDQAQTCPAGSIYCWMQCQLVPGNMPCKADRAVCMSSTTGAICPDDGTHDASCKPACPAGGSISFEIVGAGEQVVNGAYQSNGWTGSKRAYTKVPVTAQGLRAQVAWDDYWASPHFGQWIIFVSGYKNDAALYFSVSDDESPPEDGWLAADGATPLPTLDFSHQHSDGPPMRGEGFCNGVMTDMHMLGFTTAADVNDPCLILFFHSWQLTGPARFWCAFGGVIALGIFAEWLIALRRWEAGRRPATVARRCCSGRMQRQFGRLALYAVTRTIGYVVMLVTMTYSVELFTACIIGLTLGHAFFNSESSPGEDLSLCCQAGAGTEARGRLAEVGAEGMRQRLEAAGPRLRFQVTGMTCDACRTTVRRAVESLNCVVGVEELSLDTGELRVALVQSGSGGGRANGADSRSAKAEQIVTAVEAVGFQAKFEGPTEGGAVSLSNSTAFSAPF